jgi:hypothetical protein
MNSKSTNKEKPNIPKLIGIIGSSAPKLFFRFAPLMIRFKKQAKKGGEIFHKELLDQGIDPNTAEKLTAVYMQGSDISGFFKIFQ